MRIYIIGGSGMLGTAFIKHFAPNHILRTPSHSEVNITEYFELRRAITSFKPDVIINLAALCDMEACERLPVVALQTHVMGSANVALIASEIGATYVYMSSACVFDGEQAPYSTVSLTRPISTYGKTKLMGENAARSHTKHIILRSEWCFGGGPEADTKFIGKIYRQIKDGQTPLAAVGDKIGSLSYLPDLALALECILNNEEFGTFHVCCEGSATRYEIATEFVRLLDREVTVNCVPSSFFEREYSAPRPYSEVLINSHVRGFEARHWRIALAEYAKEFRGSNGRN